MASISSGSSDAATCSSSELECLLEEMFGSGTTPSSGAPGDGGSCGRLGHQTPVQQAAASQRRSRRARRLAPRGCTDTGFDDILELDAVCEDTDLDFEAELDALIDGGFSFRPRLSGREVPALSCIEEE